MKKEKRAKQVSEERKALTSAVGRYAGIRKLQQVQVWKDLYRYLWRTRGVDLRTLPKVKPSETLLDVAERYRLVTPLLDEIYRLLEADRQERAEKRETQRIMYNVTHQNDEYEQ